MRALPAPFRPSIAYTNHHHAHPQRTPMQRLRDIINKGLTNEELLRGVKTAWDKGWRQIKLYFMIGELYRSCTQGLGS